MDKPKYECPECDFDPLSLSDGGFYIVKNSVAVPCEAHYDEKAGHIFARPPEGFKAYPVYGKKQYLMHVAMEYGGNPTAWDETHCCPKHGEFSFEDSNA